MARITTGSTKNQRNSSTPSSKRGIFSGRVKKVILNSESYPDLFEEIGGYSGIGGIFFSQLQASTVNVEQDNFALPLFPNIKQPPTINEVVYIIPLPNPFSQLKPSKITYYYFRSINIWNSINHNAIPDPIYSDLEGDSKRSYQQAEAGAKKQTPSQSPDIFLGDYFNGTKIIKPLQLYEGDIIYEGRWGNSIRFGSTSLEGIPLNTWSDEGEDGDPIMILRNGQQEEDNDPWIPQIENINEDKANIYLTSTQKIPLDAVNTKYSSYDSEPTTPNEYIEPQVILNSSRLVFNAHTDSVLLSAEKSIFLGSNDSINITAANKTVIECEDIALGKKDATEPIILGNKFLTDLQNLCTQIVALGTALQTPIGAGPPFVPNAAIPVPAVNVTQAAQTMLNKIESYKSKVSKTK